jgi:hypothetical protein
VIQVFFFGVMLYYSPQNDGAVHRYYFNKYFNVTIDKKIYFVNPKGGFLELLKGKITRISKKDVSKRAKETG